MQFITYLPSRISRVSGLNLGFMFRNSFEIKPSWRFRWGVSQKDTHSGEISCPTGDWGRSVFRISLNRLYHLAKGVGSWEGHIGELRQGCETSPWALLRGSLFSIVMCSCQSKMRVNFPDTTTPLGNSPNLQRRQSDAHLGTTAITTGHFLTLKTD